MRLTLSLAALAAVLATATPALAGTSDTATAEARGTVLQPLTITRMTDLDFGWVISTAVAGNVVIDADSGARTTGLGVTPVPNYPGNRATFAGVATAATTVTLALSSPTVLVSQSNPADTVTVNSLSLDSAGPSRVVGANSSFLVGVGGDFQIGANQPNGVYSANFDLTADYQ